MTLEEIPLCVTLISGMIGIIRDMELKFGTYFSIYESLLAKHHPLPHCDINNDEQNNDINMGNYETDIKEGGDASVT